MQRITADLNGACGERLFSGAFFFGAQFQGAQYSGVERRERAWTTLLDALIGIACRISRAPAPG